MPPILIFLRSKLGLRIMAGMAVLAVIAGLALWQQGIGEQKEIDRVNKENENAGNAADAAALGFSECVARDGVHWNFATSKCVGD